jgi:hypothetical protein
MDDDDRFLDEAFALKVFHIAKSLVDDEGRRIGAPERQSRSRGGSGPAPQDTQHRPAMEFGHCLAPTEYSLRLADWSGKDKPEPGQRKNRRASPRPG